MTLFFDFIKTFVLGIIQGITEWLPISSTGHLLLFDELLPLMSVTSDFRDLFMVVIQFGSILAVVVLFWRKLWPFGKSVTVTDTGDRIETPKGKSVWLLWAKVLVAAVPAGVMGLLLDDWIEEKIYGGNIMKCSVIAGTLIVYGIIFIIVERVMAKKPSRVENLESISFLDAFLIGVFQIQALIPGTSRSGSTIIGARIAGISRPVAAEFSFFLAVPMMLGASSLKILKYLIKFGMFSWQEAGLLLVGMLVAFLVSLACIKFFMDFVRRHTFEPFGWYRIGLGAVVLGYMVVRFIVLQ